MKLIMKKDYLDVIKGNCDLKKIWKALIQIYE